MSTGGDGVVAGRPWVEVARPAVERMDFIPRRYRAGGRLQIDDSPGIQGTHLITCVLCGGLLLDERSNDEHPLPQWLHRLAADAGEELAVAFSTSQSINPTWRQLCLKAHETCNSMFARKIETPVVSPFKAILTGGRITWTELDALFDWLDKVRVSAAHMAVALRGHNLRLGYDELSYPNRRIGAFDRLALFFRVTDSNPPLDLWDCLSDGFLTTPSALALKVRDLVIITVSNNYLLSPAFGLGMARAQDGVIAYVPGEGRFSAGLASRTSRLPAAKIIAQPMRRQHRKEGLLELSSAIQQNGDGHIYELSGTRWNRVRSSDFSSLPHINTPIGYALAGLEVVEWLLLAKEQDYARYGSGTSKFMESVEALKQEKSLLLDLVAKLRGGLRPTESDRMPATSQ